MSALTVILGADTPSLRRARASATNVVAASARQMGKLTASGLAGLGAGGICGVGLWGRSPQNNIFGRSGGRWVGWEGAVLRGSAATPSWGLAFPGVGSHAKLGLGVPGFPGADRFAVAGFAAGGYRVGVPDQLLLTYVPPEAGESPDSPKPGMEMLDRGLAIGMVVLVFLSAVVQYVAGRYNGDGLLMVWVVAFWVVTLTMPPMFVLGVCGPRYRGRRAKALGARCLVIVLVLGGALYSPMLHSVGRIGYLKVTFTREIIAAIRSRSAAALSANPNERDFRLYGADFSPEVKARIRDYWHWDIDRGAPGNQPRIRLDMSNHMTRSGIMIVGLSANCRGEISGFPGSADPDDAPYYKPWLDGSFLFVGRDD